MCAPVPPWKSLATLFAMVAVLVFASWSVASPARADDGTASPSVSASPSPVASASGSAVPSAEPSSPAPSPAGAGDPVVVTLDPDQWYFVRLSVVVVVILMGAALVPAWRR